MRPSFWHWLRRTCASSASSDSGYGVPYGVLQPGWEPELLWQWKPLYLCVLVFLDRDPGPGGFSAVDGLHTAEFHGPNVCIGMRDTPAPELMDDGLMLFDTGSLHLLLPTEDLDAVDLVPEARKWRYNERFKEKGVNVNFVYWDAQVLHMRTYERGVEDETLSCGTGVTAAALWVLVQRDVQVPIQVHTRGHNDHNTVPNGFGEHYHGLFVYEQPPIVRTGPARRKLPRGSGGVSRLRVIAQIGREPTLSFRYAHTLPLSVGPDLIAVDLADGKVLRIGVREIKAADRCRRIHGV